MRIILWSLHIFVEVCLGLFLENPWFLNTKKNRSDLTSRLAAVSRLDLSYMCRKTEDLVFCKNPYLGAIRTVRGSTRFMQNPAPSGSVRRFRLPFLCFL